MGTAAAVRVGQGRLWRLVLTLVVAVALCGGAASEASAGAGSFEKKLQRFVDLCASQGGAVVPDGPNSLICQLGSPFISFDALADAERLCHGQLHGEFGLNTAESFYLCSLPQPLALGGENRARRAMAVG